MRKRRQYYWVIVAIAFFTVCSLIVLFGVWKNATDLKAMREAELAALVSKNSEAVAECFEYSNSNANKVQAETQKEEEVSQLVLAIQNFEGLSASTAYEVGLGNRYVSSQLKQLLEELASALLATSSKYDRREAIEKFEADVETLSKNFMEETGADQMPFYTSCMDYAKYLRRIL